MGEPLDDRAIIAAGNPVRVAWQCDGDASFGAWQFGCVWPWHVNKLMQLRRQHEFATIMLDIKNAMRRGRW